MATKVIMPQLGESVVEGTVTRWLKSEGEEIDEFEPLVEVNTDKVDTEIPSTASGVVLKILVPEDTTVKAGVILCWIGEKGEEVPESPLEEPDHEKGIEKEVETHTPAVSTPISPDLEVDPGRREGIGFISPVVARISGEHGVDLLQVQGTGHGGRITKKDVLAYIENQKTSAVHEDESIAPWDTSPASGGDLFRPSEEIFGKAASATEPAISEEKILSQEKGELLSLSPMRKRIAEHMVQSKFTSPHVTTVMEADLSKVIQHRLENKSVFAKNGVKLTFTPYFVMAAITALRTYPIVNSSWVKEGIFVKNEINIGMATALEPEGLIVPVIKNADSLSLLGLSRVINDLAYRARAGKLKPDEVAGGTFTITNHGIFGSLFATPIINQPQCAILGVGAIQKRVVVIQDAIAIRPMVYLSLTFDHRILDGATGDKFLAKIVETLEG